MKVKDLILTLLKLDNEKEIIIENISDFEKFEIVKINDGFKVYIVAKKAMEKTDYFNKLNNYEINVTKKYLENNLIIFSENSTEREKMLAEGMNRGIKYIVDEILKLSNEVGVTK